MTMQKIDFEIIWKKLHNTITKPEDEQLQDWLNSSKQHRNYFNDVSRFYSEGSFLDKKPVNTQEAWGTITERLHKKRKSNKLFLYVSSAAASILIVLSLLFLLSQEEQYNKITESIELIEPGSDKALLVLDDGSTFDLSANSDLSIKEGGTKINSHGTGIQYIKENKFIAKVKHNTLKIPRGGEFFIILSDSTKVWLNSETVLRYPVQFSGKERKVELIGEAFFEVKKNTKKPFIVVSANHTVKVLGTSFNISSYREDSIIFTTLVNGKVDVFLNDNPETKQTLLPNHQSYFSKYEGVVTQQEVDTYQYIAWKEGRFVFEKKPLSQMMNTLSKWYNTDIVFENEKAKDIKFTGEIKRYESFEKVLALLEKTNEIKIEIDGRLVTIK
jgi:ferric-dicitrate binding protein FerR (iron transport regulator)